MQSTHRSGWLKQKNKQHQTLGHKSNRQVKQKSGGKLNKLRSLVKKNKVVEWRNERKNREQDLKKQKRLQAFNLKRSIGQLDNSPYIVTIIYFGNDDLESNKTQMVLNFLKTCNEEDATIHQTSTGNR